MKPPDEQTVLKRSIAATILVGLTGVVFGLLSGSLSIVFDGVFSAVDASMTLLALGVTQLISKQVSNRFQMGFWHIEPMVLVFNGALLILLSFYAFLNAVGSLLSGGRMVELDWAIGYAVVIAIVCATMAIYGRRMNRTIRSEFLALDVKGWIMSGTITVALLLAFTTAAFLKGTAYETWVPYVDPAIVAVLTVCIIPLPLRTVYSGLKEIFLVAPADLDRHVQAIAKDAVARHGLLDYRTAVAKVGRLRMIEIHLIVPPDKDIGSVTTLDAIRSEIGAALGGNERDRWLTIAFTGDVKWAE